MKIVFMGSSAFGLPALQDLYSHQEYEIVAIYTQAAKPAGRGLKIKPTIIEEFAHSKNIPVFTPKNFKAQSDIDIFKSLACDIAVIAAYGLILPQVILDCPRYGCLNIHASLLPRWRGAAPIHRAIMAGDKETGVAIMKMSLGLDEGDVLVMERVLINTEDTTNILHDRLAGLGAKLLKESLQAVEEKKTIIAYPQEQQGVCYAHKITKEESLLDFVNHTAQEIIRKINGLNPFPSAYFIHNNHRYKIHHATLVMINGQAGDMTDDFTIFCKEYAIKPTIIQKEGKNKQALNDFLNGIANNQA